MNKAFRKRLIFLSVFCFFVAVMVAAYHHHDRSFRLLTCSLCKVKNAVSGISQKVKIDPPPMEATTRGPLMSAITLPTLPGVFNHDKMAPHVALLSFPYSNKSPPKTA
ncbi:MAG: hypothetical protein CSYNP_03556 [Syntrophus sp. SKADARSKE-3]|nr:hypothetical protein [Syntrophus sp. SKADARSKE-3]